MEQSIKIKLVVENGWYSEKMGIAIKQAWPGIKVTGRFGRTLKEKIIKNPSNRKIKAKKTNIAYEVEVTLAS